MTRPSLTTKLREFESTASYVSRVAALFGAPDVVTFVSWFGVRFREMCEGSVRDIERIAEVVHQDPDVLRDRMVTGNSNVRNFWGMKISRNHLRHLVDRVCPGCVNDDIVSRTGQADLRAFGRMTWMMKHHLVCPRHKRPLVKLPSIPWELSSDFRLRVARAREKSPELFEDVPAVEPSPIDSYIVGRLEGIEYEPSWLDHLPLPAVLRLCEAAGEYDPRQSTFVDGEILSNAQVNNGYIRIGGSELGFKLELEKLIARNYPRRGFTASRVFGSFATELREDLHSADFARVRAIMRNVAIDMLPLGPDDEMFGPVPDSMLHSVRTGSREYEIPATLLRKALKTDWGSDNRMNKMPMIFEKSIVEDAYLALLECEPAAVAAGKARFVEMLERERRGLEETVREETASVTADTASKLLFASGNTIWSLADEGYLALFPWKARFIASWRIANSDIADFRSRFIALPELKAVLREKRDTGCKLTVEDFQPVITQSEVGCDFFDRRQINRSI